MAESKLGEQRARVFEGELQRLRGRNDLLTRKINYQGKAIQAMGDALVGFVSAQRALERRVAFNELWAPRRWWFKVCAYCRPVWIRVVARDAAPADVDGAIAAADVEALEKILWTSVRPELGDDALIAEAYEAIRAEQEQPIEEPHDHDLARFEGEGGPAPDGDNVRPFRGKVAIGQ